MLKDVWDGVRHRRGRATLSVLAIAVGTIALTFLLAALDGLREKARHLVDELGVNVIAVVSNTRGQTSQSAAARLDEYRAALLAANLRGCAVSAARFFEPLPSDSSDVLRIVAADGNLRNVREWRLLHGRFLDAWDQSSSSRCAVITEDLNKSQGWNPGQVVTLRNVPFTVVGVVAAGTESLEQEDADLGLPADRRVVFVPITTARQWLDANSATARDLDAVFIRAPRGGDLSRVTATALRVLSAPDAVCPNCTWITPDRLLAGVRRMERVILATVGTTSLFCLLLGCTTLASLMIANVRDRVPEIGLRCALGAGPRDIAALFVVEGMLMAGIGALTGTLAAHVLLVSASSLIPCPIRLGLMTIVIPLALSVMVGGVASYQPARIAASIAPAEALRSE